MTALILALLEEHDNSLQVKACLENCGHEILVVDNFVDAIAVLGTQKIDLIVSDVHLQNGGNVFDFLRGVKGSHSTCEIPFVLFSFQPTPVAKYLADGVRTTARYLGAIKYIEMETFNAVDFREQVNGLLPKRKKPAKRDKELQTRDQSE